MLYNHANSLKMPTK